MFKQHGCPACGSTNVVKNGSTYYGKARHKCKSCQRQFVFERTHERLSDECKRRVELMLAERIWLDAICRVMEIKQQWLWLALDCTSRQVVALHVGNRGEEGVKGLWQALPEAYRQRASFYTDDWAAYKQVFPADQHRFRKTKKDTNHVERFFCTLRQRSSRLVRLSLSFSKKLNRHIKSIRFVLTNYNRSLQF